MNRYVFTLLLLAGILIFSACRTSRHLSKSDIQTALETDQTSQSGITEKVTGTVTAQTGITRDEEVVTEVTEFDTALPADPATGVPPVKRKTVQTRRTATQARQTVTADRNAVAAGFESRKSSGKSESSAESKISDRRGLNRVQSIFCLTGILTLLIVVIRIFIRRIKRNLK